jgi:hypothetical protein
MTTFSIVSNFRIEDAGSTRTMTPSALRLAGTAYSILGFALSSDQIVAT